MGIGTDSGAGASEGTAEEGSGDGEPIELGSTAKDHAIALTKLGVGAIPFIGPALAALLDFIPGQRLDRLEDFMRHLSGKVDAAQFAERMKDPDYIDLFEEGAQQTTRALSPERREQIATLVANGLSGDDAERIQSKRLLGLLAQIDDAQIIILTSYLEDNWDNAEFHARHSAILTHASTDMASTREELDAAVTHGLAKAQLIQLGLMQRRYPKPKKGELPQFDEKTGAMKSNSSDITPLGRLLLRKVGVLKGDF